MREWLAQVFILTSMSLLNNWAFAFHVPLTLQIVFRSAGLAVSMILNRVFLKKSYTVMQVVAVAVVSAGVLVATLSRPTPPSRPSDAQGKNHQPYQYAIGIGMLSLATILTSTLGIVQERMFAKYGAKTWREGVFYTHLLSLPVFAAFFSDVKRGLRSLSQPSDTLPHLDIKLPILERTVVVPPLYLALLLNVASQSICVSGANRLTSTVTAVTTNLILTARKALSLCISVWYFGQGMNAGLTTGALLVLFGTLMYSYATSRAKASSTPTTNGFHKTKDNMESEVSPPPISTAERRPNGVRKRRLAEQRTEG
ncbi:golgi uridine diphosphate-N- acetylglucosamine transporter [Tulasnella sp. 427]|nr:golgi uridine diphosphate-N- acetylglucosamine transporter [Tulasnella sp. 427]